MPYKPRGKVKQEPVAVGLDQRLKIAAGGYIRAKEAEKRYSVSRKTLDKMVEKGLVLVTRPVGFGSATKLYCVASIEAAFAAGINLTDAGTVDASLWGDARQRALQAELLQIMVAA